MPSTEWACRFPIGEIAEEENDQVRCIWNYKTSQITVKMVCTFFIVDGFVTRHWPNQEIIFQAYLQKLTSNLSLFDEHNFTLSVAFDTVKYSSSPTQR